MAHNSSGCIYEFVAAALCAKVVYLSIGFQAEPLILLDKHAADRINSHTCTGRRRKCRYHLLERSIFKPQDSVGNILDALVM